MTNDNDDGDLRERLAWQPKTPRAERGALDNAPLATLTATPASEQARALTIELALRYPRIKSATGKAYAPRANTLADYENAGGAFIADLLDAVRRDRSDGWLRVSQKKADYSGQPIAWRTLDGVQTAWLKARLLEHKAGYPGMLAMGNPGPSQGKLTRYRATPALLAICAEHAVTPENVREHFKFVPVMPSELVRLTKPHHKTPETPTVHRLRADVAALNAFMREHTLTHPTKEIVHLGWVRLFHQAEDLEAYRWNKGGRLYSQPQDGAGCYQQISEDERVKMLIDGEAMAEVDISSSYLTIFYAWIGQPLDTDSDAYANILGPTKLDRVVTKFFINYHFGNGAFLRAWRAEHVADVRKILKKKMAPDEFNPKHYNLREVQRRVLQHHPLLQRWGNGGLAKDWSDLMYAESKVVIGSMKKLMAQGVPSLPVHDSLLVPASHQEFAIETITSLFQSQLGVRPSLEVTSPA